MESSGAFEASEIIVRIEYKYCPNLIIIDTPGLLAPPGAAGTAVGGSPRHATGGEGAYEEDDGRWAAQQAAVVEQLVMAKIRPSEHVILCIEETNNWQLSPSRALVTIADPELRRRAPALVGCGLLHGAPSLGCRKA